MKIATVTRGGLPTWQVIKLAGEARLDPRTVRRVLEGQAHTNRRQQVLEAALRLGMVLPDLDGQATRIRAT
jgi:hypothetical protein